MSLLQAQVARGRPRGQDPESAQLRDAGTVERYQG